MGWKRLNKLRGNGNDMKLIMRKQYRNTITSTVVLMNRIGKSRLIKPDGIFYKVIVRHSAYRDLMNKVMDLFSDPSNPTANEQPNE